MRTRLLLTISSLLGACSSNSGLDGAPAQPVDLSQVRDAIPRYEARTRAGNPPQYTIDGVEYVVMAESTGYRERGIASWYGTKFHGRKTANGEIYDMYAMTAAHKTLPIPSYVRVTNLNNQRSVILRINDRGPFKEGRIIDLSYAAAVKLGVDKTGTAPVEVTAIEAGGPSASNPASLQQTMAASTAAPIYLKVGAFRDSLNADRLKDKLLQAALPVKSTTTADPDGSTPIHRLYVGPLTSAAMTEQTRRQLLSLGIQSIQVIRQPVPGTTGVVQ